MVIGYGSGVRSWEQLLGTPWLKRSTNCAWFALEALGLPSGENRWDRIFQLPEISVDQVKRGDLIVWTDRSVRDEYRPCHVALHWAPGCLVHSGAATGERFNPATGKVQFSDNVAPLEVFEARFFTGREL
ncbi:MAG: hypothetical protein CMK74_05960 [Pseudomonadales bacterium]|nr:hypothetical protein [Pseudomonadales bacterium]|tara:strand:+ start:146 stop:535 length:390 start_codon:yes stop_codon:yes gene_type:complete